MMTLKISIPWKTRTIDGIEFPEFMIFVDGQIDDFDPLPGIRPVRPGMRETTEYRGYTRRPKGLHTGNGPFSDTKGLLRHGTAAFPIRTWSMWNKRQRFFRR